MAWMILMLAGLLETGLAIGLKYSEGFTRLVPSVLTIVAMVSSIWLLSVAMRTLPVGTAYPVWVGLGAAGAAILGVVLFGEPLTTVRIGFLLMLFVSIIGLRMTSPG